MRSIGTIIFAVALALPGYGQLNRQRDVFPLTVPAPAVHQPKNFWIRSLIRTDRQTTYRLRVPYVATRANTTMPYAESYWTAAMTTQSFNNGKIGTYYYWDIQGNLRETRLFLDIAGKHKRGLKLVFPRR